MKRLLIMLGMVALLLPSFAYAQTVTTIANIQDTTGTGSADSPMLGQVVTVEGIISGESWAFGGKYYIQDGSGPWSGILVYGDWGRNNAYGDSVRITATVAAYKGLTQLASVTEYVKLDSGKTVEPTLVTTGEIGTNGAMAEAYESVLVQVMNVAITNPDLGYGEWEVNDGSGPCRVDDAADYYYDPADYDSTKSITGVLDYSHGDTKILPRLAYDVVETGEFTRLQRIQQVRYSDLVKAPYTAGADASYMFGDTVTVTGVVTMPTGLSFAGAGIKFIFEDPKGGPWSAILSYHPDSTAYPSLFEGDSIKMTGYIGEYNTGPSYMTEFWITSPIEWLGIASVPPVDTVATGDLRWPTTAEPWGNVMIAAKNAVVKNLTPQYELFTIDDGTGEILVDSDSDSMNTFPDPPQGTILESVRGWVYHHYGSYADSTTYKLEPLYKGDIVLGKAPPAISETHRNPGIPTSADPVEITTMVKSNLNLANVDLLYNVDGGDYQVVPMTASTLEEYKGTIPAQAQGSFVNYFIKATDASAQVSIDPFDTTLYNYCYPVTDGNLTIADIQNTPWPRGDTPFEGVKVTLTAFVTSDTAMNNNYKLYSIQDGTNPYDGMWVFGSKVELSRGDKIEVTGMVTDYHEDGYWKWAHNTIIEVETVNVLATGQDLPATSIVSTGDLSNTVATAEAYEGLITRVENVTVSSINKYDFTVDDGSGPCLIDDDGLPSGVAKINSGDGIVVLWGDTLRVGDVIDYVQGVFTFSYGTYKIELRDADDAGTVTGVNENVPTYPLTYDLEQNFPNPFNPETRLSFSVPQTSHVKIAIYNSLGQLIRILVDESYAPGRHVVNWDGRNQDTQLVPSGMYFYRMKAGDYIETMKMMFLK